MDADDEEDTGPFTSLVGVGVFALVRVCLGGLSRQLSIDLYRKAEKDKRKETAKRKSNKTIIVTTALITFNIVEIV